MTNKPMVLANDRIVWVDCDDTLIMWDLSAYPDLPRVKVQNSDEAAIVVPNLKNINTIKKFYKLGYKLIVHSGSGHLWAEAVVKALELQPYVTLIMSKPMYYFDDYSVVNWIGPRIWRDPLTGKNWSE